MPVKKILEIVVLGLSVILTAAETIDNAIEKIEND